MYIYPGPQKVATLYVNVLKTKQCDFITVRCSHSHSYMTISNRARKELQHCTLMSLRLNNVIL